MTASRRRDSAAATSNPQHNAIPDRAAAASTIRRLLIANRGEIACRIMRTCRAMGVATVAVYSDADEYARHVREADEALHIGASDAASSYLDVQAILAAAARAQVDAVHPGYGFLSENAAFASACRDAGLTFVGPPTEVIARVGNKIEAKQIATAAGVPVVPGYSGADQSEARLASEALAIGLPVMVKAAAGGGGKGMRVIAHESDLTPLLASARREALAAFGDGALLLEKLVRDARHIEVQIFGDHQGHVIHLGERECSIQRRHQKLIEETPCAGLSQEQRAQLLQAAVAIGRQLGYANAGTVEFLVDTQGGFYFLEVNARLQVEHPVTELVTGLDLVRWQIRVAEGHPLPLAQEQITSSRHAIEARLYAESAEHDFLPATGQILRWRAAESEGTRADAGVATGDAISPFYDALVAKVVAHGEDRDEALRRLDRALADTVLFGVPNNRAFLRRVLRHPDFCTGRVSTDFIERHRSDLVYSAPDVLQSETGGYLLPDAAIVAAMWRVSRQQTTGHWRNNPGRPVLERYRVLDAIGEAPRAEVGTIELGIVRQTAQRFQVIHGVAGAEHRLSAELLDRSTDTITLTLDGRRFSSTVAEGEDGRIWIALNGSTVVLRRVSEFPVPRGLRALTHGRDEWRHEVAEASASGAVRAPLPGQVVIVHVLPGNAVRAGDPLVVIEAMKMEHIVRAPHDGVVETIHVVVGNQTQHGALLITLSGAS